MYRMDYRKYLGKYVKITKSRGTGKTRKKIIQVGRLDSIKRFELYLTDRPNTQKDSYVKKPLVKTDKIKVLTKRERQNYYKD